MGKLEGAVMVMEIMVDGVVYAEVPRAAAPVAAVRASVRRIGWVDAEVDFRLRLGNWRRVVADRAPDPSGVCAAWARWYVNLRVSEPAPDDERQALAQQPPRPMVAADVMDGWLVEAAYRQLGDFNERMALKCRHIYGFDDVRMRTKLKGVRGPQVRILIARAEKNLREVLKRLESAPKIRPTTCLPGCPVPTAANGASVMEASARQ